MGGQRHAPADLTPEKDPVPIVQEAGWAPGPVWIGAENLAPHRDSIPDLPARSESLYRLLYPALPIKHTTNTKERSMPSAGFDPTIMAIKRLQKYALYSKVREIETVNSQYYL